MYKVSHKIFNEAKYKHKHSKLLVIGLFFFIFACLLSGVHLCEQWGKYQLGEDVLNDFFLTHKFMILILLQLLFSLPFFATLRPAFAFDTLGIYIRPGFVYSSCIYLIPWKCVETISEANGKDDEGDWILNILVETNLESSKMPKFNSGIFGNPCFEQFNFCFTISFLSFSYQKEFLRTINRLKSKSVNLDRDNAK